MSRPLRIEYDGALYHITARGNEKNPIYRGERDYQKFLQILSDLPRRYGVIIHAYVLMENHYHFLIETPKANIAKAIHYLNTTYTGYFNMKYKRAGHLFQGRYRGLLIEKESYLHSVSRYIHLNPVQAGLVKKPEEYKWSSYPEYIGRTKGGGLITCDWILGQFSGDRSVARRLYRRFVDEGVASKVSPFGSLKAGLILGDDNFIQDITKRLNLKKHREIPESKRLLRGVSLEDVMKAVTKRFGIDEEEIRATGRRDNLARKISLYLLRKRTDQSNEEIGKCFGIGYTAVSQAVSRMEKELRRDGRLARVVAGVEKELLSEM
jgi:REP element-mobilizing transposase RayT